jgi:hypothetical protein
MKAAITSVRNAPTGPASAELATDSIRQVRAASADVQSDGSRGGEDDGADVDLQHSCDRR